MNKLTFLTLTILLLAPLAATAQWENEFVKPPMSARPHVYWYWMGGNISREGITADLEAMARVGIGGAAIFNIGGHGAQGNVVPLTPEWRELMGHALREAKRLGIEINLNNSMVGWSSSGGPWITPELAMQCLTWSETAVSGQPSAAGGAIVLPQPPGHLGFYRDVAVLAFPTPEAECGTNACEFTSNMEHFERKLVDRFSITGAHSFHNSTVEKGAGYPADISIRGSQVLVDRCTSHGLGGFYVATLDSAAMLNVVLNCTFEGEGSIQPHMHWSTGLLIDSCHIPDGRIDLINRHTSGSGHGWAIGWGIAWNCTAKYLQIQTPPGALNLAIGCKGEPHKTFNQEAIFSANAPVTPASLYLAQLRERLGEAAVKNIGY